MGALLLRLFEMYVTFVDNKARRPKFSSCILCPPAIHVLYQFTVTHSLFRELDMAHFFSCLHFFNKENSALYHLNELQSGWKGHQGFLALVIVSQTRQHFPSGLITSKCAQLL